MEHLSTDVLAGVMSVIGLCVVRQTAEQHDDRCKALRQGALVALGTMAATGSSRDYEELMRENVMDGSLSTYFDVDVRSKLGS